MPEIVGIYDHEWSENLDGYLKAVGVPFMARKMACTTSPRMTIEKNGEKWRLQNATMFFTTDVTFLPGVEYEESMPSGHRIKNVTNLEGNSLVTTLVAANGSPITRRYDFTDEGVTLTMTHEESGQVAVRFYKRTAAT